ncbi:hypothetical protein B0H16DRAFT_1458780 [Mycena metata]|uniref:Uncharacterized protein n=1 Tax=Mycena metata TaxID=1033252 RepID=A0AAD7NCM6_9AGAR|nr:hypothetical protein B0H16DRAFT_1458780 [Mycena metata]
MRDRVVTRGRKSKAGKQEGRDRFALLGSEVRAPRSKRKSIPALRCGFLDKITDPEFLKVLCARWFAFYRAIKNGSRRPSAPANGWKGSTFLRGDLASVEVLGHSSQGASAAGEYFDGSATVHALEGERANRYAKGGFTGDGNRVWGSSRTQWAVERGRMRGAMRWCSTLDFRERPSEQPKRSETSTNRRRSASAEENYHPTGTAAKIRVVVLLQPTRSFQTPVKHRAVKETIASRTFVVATQEAPEDRDRAEAKEVVSAPRAKVEFLVFVTWGGVGPGMEGKPSKAARVEWDQYQCSTAPILWLRLALDAS